MEQNLQNSENKINENLENEEEGLQLERLDQNPEGQDNAEVEDEAIPTLPKESKADNNDTSVEIVGKDDKAAEEAKDVSNPESEVDTTTEEIGNSVMKKLDEILESEGRKKEESKIIRGIKAELKNDGIPSKAIDYVLKLLRMEGDVRANFLQDTRILMEAIELYVDFEIPTGIEDRADAPDPMAAAESA